MENHQDQLLGQQVVPARQVVFGESLGPFPRLYSELIGYETDGYSYVWKRILQCADDEILEDILAALRQGSEVRNKLLLLAICGGYDGMGKPMGKNGLLKRSARRFAYHALETVDMACFLGGVGEAQQNSASFRKYRGLLSDIQNGFSWLTPPSKSHDVGPLNEKDSLLAKAFVITKGIQRDGAMEPGVHFLAENYDEMKPYFHLIYSTAERSTVNSLRALLATRPELALASGAL